MFDYKMFKKEMTAQGYEVNKCKNQIIVYANPRAEITQYSGLICHTDAYRQKRLEFMDGYRDGKAVVFARFRIRAETETGEPVVDEMSFTVDADEAGIITIHAPKGKSEIVLYDAEQAEQLIDLLRTAMNNSPQ
ncbi:MAG: hypothetical protein J6C19_07290 [Lachnospiraceae bacterium]|nr:hypothetical protein [Lachnospiraceae bacterium]